LFDTLIARHTAGEIVAVLAHEMGHYRRHHIARHIALSVLSTGLMLFILAQFIADPALSAAFGVTHHSVYAGLIFFAFLYAPLGMLLGLAGNALSRRYEYEADAYATSTTRRPEDMIAALKKLSADNLSNLTPHPLKVFLHYGHPPVLARIRAIRARAAREG
jgi:STE24 endopeptidase